MIRVLIERRVCEGMVETYETALREMRVGLVHHDGYVSGEFLKDTTDRHHFVSISTWTDRAAWERWVGSEARRNVITRVAPMLEEPDRITILEPV